MKSSVCPLNPSASVCVAVSYSDNSSACLSMLSSHDNWSGLQMPTHSSMMPVAHNSTSGTNSRFVYFLFVFIASTQHITERLTNTKQMIYTGKFLNLGAGKSHASCIHLFLLQDRNRIALKSQVLRRQEIQVLLVQVGIK